MVQLIQILIAFGFHLIDFASGLVYAFKQKTINSSKMRDGMFKKMGFVLCYIIAILLDNCGKYIGLNISIPILPAIILYSVTTELVSITENIAKINKDLVPDKLLSLFHIDVK